MESERPDLGSERLDLGSERPDLGSKRHDLEFEMPDLWFRRPNTEFEMPDQGPVSKPGRFCIFFNNTIHYTIFQSIGPIQYNTNTIQYLKELYPIRNNILIHLIKNLC